MTTKNNRHQQTRLLLKEWKFYKELHPRATIELFFDSSPVDIFDDYADEEYRAYQTKVHLLSRQMQKQTFIDTIPSTSPKYHRFINSAAARQFIKECWDAMWTDIAKAAHIARAAALDLATIAKEEIQK